MNYIGKRRRRQLVKERLVQMNNHFGRGDIVRVVFVGSYFGYVTRRIPTSQTGGFKEDREFSFTDDLGKPTFSLRFLRHRSNYAKPFRI